MKQQYLQTGKIVSTHGVHGEVKLLPWADSPEFLLQFHTLYLDGKPFRVEQSRVQKTCVLVKLAGIDTVEAAEAHLKKLAQLHTREREVLRLLDIPARPLVERERTYIAAWQDMGFDNEALRLAYEKTVMKKQSMDWGYMNGILRRWHEKGLHTVAAIQAGDGLRRNRGGAPAQGRTPQPGEERRVREDMERMRRLMEQMKREEE